MYDSFDGTFIRREVVPSSSAASRSPWVPLLGVPIHTRYLMLGLCTPTWIPCTSTWALCTPHVAFQSCLDILGEALEAQKI